MVVVKNPSISVPNAPAANRTPRRDVNFAVTPSGTAVIEKMSMIPRVPSTLNAGTCSVARATPRISKRALPPSRTPATTATTRPRPTRLTTVTWHLPGVAPRHRAKRSSADRDDPPRRASVTSESPTQKSSHRLPRCGNSTLRRLRSRIRTLGSQLQGEPRRRTASAARACFKDHLSGQYHRTHPSVRFADAELDRRIRRERSTGPVPEALDEPKPTHGEQQWQLLGKDAPELKRCDDEVGLEV